MQCSAVLWQALLHRTGCRTLATPRCLFRLQKGACCLSFVHLTSVKSNMSGYHHPNAGPVHPGAVQPHQVHAQTTFLTPQARAEACDGHYQIHLRQIQSARHSPGETGVVLNAAVMNSSMENFQAWCTELVQLSTAIGSADARWNVMYQPRAIAYRTAVLQHNQLVKTSRADPSVNKDQWHV